MDNSPTPPKVLTRNAVKCRGCGAIVESKHRHDFVRHDCPKDPRIHFFVDGGKSYARRGWGEETGFYQTPEQNYEEACEYGLRPEPKPATLNKEWFDAVVAAQAEFAVEEKALTPKKKPRAKKAKPHKCLRCGATAEWLE